MMHGSEMVPLAADIVASSLVQRFTPLDLGAPLYVPATMDSIVDISQRQKYTELKSVIFCTEDSIHDAEVPRALLNIDYMLSTLSTKGKLKRFIRVRSPEVLGQCLGMAGIEQIDGFVLPKVTLDNLRAYLDKFPAKSPHLLMLTLETREAFQASAMEGLREQLLTLEAGPRVVALRIGGNDLMNLLGIRRGVGKTIYDTPLRHTLVELLTMFKPFGFQLSAPVFEYLQCDDTLSMEVAMDIGFGFLPKAAIHPNQVPLIESQYRVSSADLAAAHAVLDEGRPAIFRYQQFMCEPTTHLCWAHGILNRARVFGIA